MLATLAKREDRALYTFSDDDSSWNVYKHHDGYPKGAATVLRHAISYFAFSLPRFEADEFAAAFVAAGKAWCFAEYLDTQKTHRGRRAKMMAAVEYHAGAGRVFGGGGVRLMPQGDPDDVAMKNCTDIEFRYAVMMGNGNAKLIIKAVLWSEVSHLRRTFFYGPFEDFEKAAKKGLFEKNDYASIYDRPPGEGEKGQRKEPVIEHEHTGNVA